MILILEGKEPPINGLYYLSPEITHLVEWDLEYAMMTSQCKYLYD